MSGAMYSVYQLYGRADLLPFRNKPYSYFKDQGLKITSKIYHMIFMKDMEKDLTIFDIRDDYETIFPDKKIEPSDVILVNRNCVLYAYFCDGDDFLLIEGFIPNSSSDAVIEYNTKDYIIEGYGGEWYAAESLNINGKNYYLMEHQELGKSTFWIILNEMGEVIVDKVSDGFRGDVINIIKNRVRSASGGGRRLENWQKAYENGEYLRTAELSEEQNYNMIDGVINNKRPSVLGRLIEKKQEVSSKYGSSGGAQRDEIIKK